MNNPNPFLPQGSLLEQQSRRQSRMKLAVFCVLLVSVTGLMAMLIQGCKRTPEQVGDNTGDNNASMGADTNFANQSSLPADTNAAQTEVASNAMPPMTMSNAAPPMMPPPAPIATPTPAVAPPMATEVPAAGSEYTIVHGDTLGRIAKKFGVSVKALENANPNVQPTRLKVGQKITIPAGGKSSVDNSNATSVGTTEGGIETYVVKPGDNLTKIARKYGTSVKAIKAANKMSSTRITVGQKLKIPVKAEAPVAPAPAAPVDMTTAPTSAPVTPAPVNTPAPVPGTGH